MEIIKLLFFFHSIVTAFSSFSSNTNININTNIIKPKLCIHCEHFKNSFMTGNKFGKCALFYTKTEDKYYLVDGSEKVSFNNYHYCSTARSFEDMCGKEGKHYKEKEKKRFFQLFEKDM